MLKEKTHNIIIYGSVFILIFTFCFSFCSNALEPITIDLIDVGPEIIIEGIITNQIGPYTVTVNKKGDYLKFDEDFPPVTDANVTISDDMGNSESLSEISDGVYRTSIFQGYPGRTYTLKVITDGKEYKATSYMPHSIELDSLRFIRRSYYNSEYSMLFYFTDKEGIDDNYRFRVYRNGYLVNQYYHLYNDEFTDGEHITVDYYENITLNYYDYITVTIWSFDRAAYDFYNSMRNIIDIAEINQEEEIGPDIGNSEDEDAFAPAFLPVTLFNPTTNLTNNAIGYFSAINIRTFNFRVR